MSSNLKCPMRRCQIVYDRLSPSFSHIKLVRPLLSFCYPDTQGHAPHNTIIILLFLYLPLSFLVDIDYN